MTVQTQVFLALVTLATVSSASQSDCPKLNQGSNYIGSCPRVVCYIPHYAPHRRIVPPLDLDKLDLSLCTHLLYGFADIVDNKLEYLHKYELDMRKVVNKSSKFPNLKVMLTVGNGPPKRHKPGFITMVNSAQNRSQFIHSSIKYLRDNGLDGIDLNWEFPNNNKRPGEMNNFAALCQEMREAMEIEAKVSRMDPLMLSIAASKLPRVWKYAYNMTSLKKSVDFFSMMTYDMTRIRDKKTRHFAPLYSTKDGSNNEKTPFYNVDSLMKEWVIQGGCKSQLVMGIGFFGKTYQLKNSSDYKVYADGEYTRRKVNHYSNICQMKNATSYYDKVQQAAYMVNGNEWIAYENPQSIAAKVDYVQENGLGGVMVWEMSHDDHTGACGQGRFPLMKAIVKQCTNGQAKDSVS